VANNWYIPAWLETEVRARDKACVYCGTLFTSSCVPQKSAVSCEHIINDEKSSQENMSRFPVVGATLVKDKKTTLGMVAVEILPRTRNIKRVCGYNIQTGNCLWPINSA